MSALTDAIDKEFKIQKGEQKLHNMSIQTKEIKKLGEAVPHWVACVTSEGAKIF